MKRFDDMTPEEQEIFRLEAMIEDELAELIARIDPSPTGGSERVRNRDAALEKILASMADHFPDRAADLRRYFDALKRGDCR